MVAKANALRRFGNVLRTVNNPVRMELNLNCKGKGRKSTQRAHGKVKNKKNLV